jgi:hypothetical protein
MHEYTFVMLFALQEHLAATPSFQDVALQAAIVPLLTGFCLPVKIDRDTLWQPLLADIYLSFCV